MAHIIVLASIKGGVGKTTTCMNLAAALRREFNYNILLIDADFQGNLTDATVQDFEKINHTMFDLIKDEELMVSECTMKTNLPNVDIVPSDLQLMQASRILDPESSPMAVFALKNKIDGQAKKKYDYILIDTHPDINILTTNALTSSTAYILPVFPDRHLIKAVQMTSDYISKAKQANTELKELGILIGNYDGRKKIAGLMHEKAQKFYGDRLMKTIIHTNTAIEKAALSGESVFQYDLRQKGCQYFRELAHEVHRKVGDKDDS